MKFKNDYLKWVLILGSIFALVVIVKELFF